MAPVILGISSYTYGWAVSTTMNEADLIDKALHFGVKRLQIGDNLPLDKFSRERLENFRSLAINSDITIEVGARKLTAENLHRYCEIASFLKSPLLRFVIDDEDYEPAMEQVIQILKESLPELKARNIVLGIENHDRFKAKALAGMMDAIADDRIGICLDCVNSIGAGEGLEWVSSILIPYTVNLHIKDFTIRRFPHKMGFTVTGAPAGSGMTGISDLLEKLSKYEKCRSAVLEQWVEPESTMEETIKKESRWAEEGMRYLRRLPYFKNQKTEIQRTI